MIDTTVYVLNKNKQELNIALEGKYLSYVLKIYLGIGVSWLTSQLTFCPFRLIILNNKLQTNKQH